MHTVNVGECIVRAYTNIQQIIICYCVFYYYYSPRPIPSLSESSLTDSESSSESESIVRSFNSSPSHGGPSGAPAGGAPRPGPFMSNLKGHVDRDPGGTVVEELCGNLPVKIFM